MMETVLNIGLNDESVQGLAKQSRQRALRLGLLPPADPDVRQDRARHRRRALRATPSTRSRRPRAPTNDLDLDADDLRTLVDTFKGIVREHAGRDFPQDPREQMDLAIKRRLRLVERDRARSSTAARSASPPTSAPRSTSARWCSATSAWTPAPASPSPATRAAAQQGVYGDYLQNAQGEDVVAGIRNTVPLPTSSSIDKPAYDELLAIMATLENHYRDLCDIEFTIERNKLWMLQTRVGKRTAGGGVPHRHPARRRGPHRPRRGAAPGHRRRSSPS